MSIASIILVYALSWWMTFFCMLPIGVKSQLESEDGVIEGTDPGAPVNPNFKKKLLATTIVAALFTILYHWIATSGLIVLRHPVPH
ncbi:DUF1467 family protein [Kordiimonas marina]|uniref:DUF1467 family protein n=1 Tax=Kordiimonas marina TaxID=2872312 RepID=UPI001FF13D01|nr:DUF1467 family protein [Kordiimonas marina]MCJ9428743.1 DUF1467 family protein [Kordiimonas marina]